MITTQDVSFYYGNKQILDSINLSFDKGIHGILGPNGAGKTTLLRILATEIPPKTGKLSIYGKQIKSYDDARKSRVNIGYLPQNIIGMDRLRVYEMVSYVGQLRGIPQNKLSTAVTKAIDTVELSQSTNSRIATLSGGMKQRAGLACALVGDPKFLILDEPTVGLDPAQRYEFKNILRSRTDAIILLSTHIVEDVAAIASSVVVIDKGKTLFNDSVTHLAEIASTNTHGDSALERGYLQLLEQNRHQHE